MPENGLSAEEAALSILAARAPGPEGRPLIATRPAVFTLNEQTPIGHIPTGALAIFDGPSDEADLTVTIDMEGKTVSTDTGFAASTKEFFLPRGLDWETHRSIPRRKAEIDRPFQGTSPNSPLDFVTYLAMQIYARPDIKDPAGATVTAATRARSVIDLDTRDGVTTAKAIYEVATNRIESLTGLRMLAPDREYAPHAVRPSAHLLAKASDAHPRIQRMAAAAAAACPACWPKWAQGLALRPKDNSLPASNHALLEARGALKAFDLALAQSVERDDLKASWKKSKALGAA